MSLATDFLRSSSNEDFFAYLDEALNSSDSSPEEEREDDDDDVESRRCCFMLFPLILTYRSTISYLFKHQCMDTSFGITFIIKM